MSEFSGIELWVLRILRVPPGPEPPEGSAGSIQVFHAGRNFYTWCVLVWLISHVAVLVLLLAAHFIVALNFSKWPPWVQFLCRGIELAAWLAFTGSAFITFFSQRLNYRLRWYMVTDRSLRIRTGILAMQEITMTFSNIQEIRLSAGPIQNLLKIADVEVHSAGGGGGGGKGNDDRHVGRFEGVSNANAIRDLMVERLRQYRDSGLGETTKEASPSEDHAIHAARAVLAETRALSEQLTRPANR